MDRGASASPLVGRLAVLVVDDHPINREWLHAGLSQRVARVVVAENGAEAIERCKQQTFDVVLMDLHMPDMDGWTTAVSIRDLLTGPSCPRMIALSGESGDRAEKQHHDDPFDASLRKPVGIEGIVTAIERLLVPGPAPSDRDRATDPVALLDLQSALRAAQGDRGLVRRLQTMLADELRTRLPALERCLLRRDRAGAGEILHQWIGACGYAGARRLARDCRDLQAALEEVSPRNRAQACLRFLRTVAATEARLRQD